MKELIKKTEKELKQMLLDKKEALRVFKFAMSGGKVKNMKEGQALKKEIAQIMTLLSGKTMN
jgi:ribosomal protein L29